MSSTITSHFSPLALEGIDISRVPRHIAIIPDGNRRWAKKRFFIPTHGHEKGAERIIATVKAALELEVQVITFYLFSTENWKRPQYEVSALMHLLEKFIRNKIPEMQESGIRLQTIGDLSKLPQSVQATIAEAKKATEKCSSIDMVLALNYGGRDDLCRAYKRIAASGIHPDTITEQTIAAHLDTAPWPDPDLVIRTGSENRVSNFLLWQICYSELYVVDTLWPDFTPDYLALAVSNFQARTRRLGGSL